MKLFIIGNGFDIAHGINSKYSDFKKFLEEYEPLILESDMPDPVIYLKKGKLYCDSKNAANIIWHLIDYAERRLSANMDAESIEWNYVEDALGKLDYTLCFNKFGEGWDFEKDCIQSKWEFSLENQYRALQIAAAVLQIHNFFDKWVNQIETQKVKAKSDFKKLIDKNDIFINFNYTDVLESIYKCKNIWHIHGRKGDKEIIFGHGNIDFDDNDYEQVLYGAAAVLENIHEILYKDVRANILRNVKQWENLKEVTSIYTYGFSYGYADRLYIQKIIKSCPNCKEWYIEGYPKVDEIEEYMNRVIDMGFNGRIKVFIIEN